MRCFARSDTTTRSARPYGRADSSTRASARWALAATLGAIVLLALPAAASADVGFRDFSYGTSTSAPTAEKPQSKLWFNDGLWWGSMYNKLTGRFEIYKLSSSSQAWSAIGEAIDERENTRSDTLWDGEKLYVVSAGTSRTNTAHGARLLRYGYDSATKDYSLDPGFPVTLTSTGMDEITIEKDSAGKLWVAYTQGSNVYLNHSTTDDLAWRTPYVMPSPGATNLLEEDEAGIVRYDDKLGVMWSNQADNVMYFASHTTGDPDDQWQANPALKGKPGEKLADNHLNLKGLDSDPAGQVFAAAKTSLTGTTDSLINVLTLKNGTWSRSSFGTVSQQHTRAIVQVDPGERQLYVFASTPCCSGGKIYYKQSKLDSIAFPTNLGAPFIDSSLDTKLNNPTSTNENMTAASGGLVLASDDGTRRYQHNVIEPGEGAPDTILDTGPSGTVEAPSASFTFSANEVDTTFECRLDGGAWAPCSSPKGFSGLRDGEHTFQVRARTERGADPTAASRTWTVDTTTTTTSHASIADSYVDGNLATKNYGAATKLSVDGSPRQESYLRFGVGALPGPVVEAKLRVYANGGTVDGPAVYATDGSWTEGGLNFNNRPAATSAARDDKGNIPDGSFVDYDVTPFVTGAGTFDFKLAGTSSDGMDVSSREATSNRPQLLVKSWTTPPDTTIDSWPSDPSKSSSPSFTFSSDKPGTTFECRLDGGAFAPCASPKGYDGLADGGHDFEARAVDSNGQVDPTPANHSWSIDTTAPPAPELTDPADGVITRDSTVTVAGTADPGATVEMLDGSSSHGTTTADAGGDWTQTLDELPDGAHELAATASDAAGNTSPRSAPRTIHVDTTAPRTSVDSGPSARTASSSAIVSFSADDPNATFRCSLDGAEPTPCTSPQELTGLPEGEHTFEVSASDAAGNSESTPATRSWTVDTTEPAVSSVRPADGATGAGPQTDVEATFSEEIDPSTLTTTTFTLVGEGDSTPISASVRRDAGGSKAILAPETRLEDDTTYVATLTSGADGIKDLTGNALAADHSWSFATAADNTPETTIDSGPSGVVGSDSAELGFSADVSGSTFECRLDGGAFEPCSSPQGYASLADGSHTFAVRAIGLGGTPDPTPASRTWTVEMVLFDDGFESGDFAAWSLMRKGGDGTATVQGTTVNAGSQAARLSATANTGSYAYARKELPSAETDVSVSASVRVEQEGLSGGNVPLLRLYDAAGTRVVNLYRQNASGGLVRVTHGSTTSSTPGRLPLNTWARVRVHAVTAGPGAGTFEVFLDGTEVYRTTTATLPAAGLKTLQVGNDTARQPFILLADDVLTRR